MKTKTNFVHVVPQPFEGLRVNIKDNLSIMTSVAASFLIMKTKEFTWEKGLQYISPRELFYTLISNFELDNVAQRTLRALNIDNVLAKYLIYHRISLTSKNKCSIDEMKFDNDFCALIKKAKEKTKDAGQKYIWTHHLLLALFDNEEKPQEFLWSPNRILNYALRLTPTKIRNVANKLLQDFSAKEEVKKNIG